MTSNLACLGFRITDTEEMLGLIREVLPLAAHVGTADGVETYRWQDSSGARIVLGFRDGDVVDFLPSFAGEPGAVISECEPVDEEVARAAIYDENGDQVAGFAFELEQRRALAGREPYTGAASLIAFGADVQLHADAEAFRASPHSVMSAGDDPGGPPPEFSERGWTWPARWSSESFLSYGAFADPSDADAHARLNGTVLRSERRTNSMTGGEFVVSRVRTFGFEADVLQEGTAEVAAPGAVLAGMVFLVGCADGLGFDGPPRRRRRWRRS